MKKLRLTLVVLALLGLCFTPAWAQDNELDEGAFGTKVQATFINAWEFDPTVNFGTPFVDFDQYGIFNLKERWSRRIDGFDFTNFAVWAAGLRLPDGAKLVGAKLYAYDSANPGLPFILGNPEIVIEVRREELSDNGPTVPEVIGTAQTQGNPGYTVATADIDAGERTINNRKFYYWVRVDTNATAGFEDLEFRKARHRLIGVKLFWQRQVKTSYDRNDPTFFDVPGYLPNGAENPYFDAIEALADAGITVGCGPGPLQNFCPETGIPRKELAVWLYKALGLNFGN